MSCYNPIKGFRSHTTNENGKRPLVFNAKNGNSDQPQEVSCGKCIGCRLETSRDWAVRMTHEAKMHEENCFITLTYEETNLPIANSLYLPHVTTFLKKLRDRLSPHKIRYFHAGEYGDDLQRPHYHMAIFNYDYPDKKPHYKNDQGHQFYISEQLLEDWPHGHADIGELTFETAAYMARYITKKITSPKDDPDYAKRYYTDPKTSLLRRPEYSTQSSGIGYSFYKKYKSDFQHNYCVVNGHQQKIPKYYLKKEKEDDEKRHIILHKRPSLSMARAHKKSHPEEYKTKRIETKEKHRELITKTLKRNLT